MIIHIPMLIAMIIILMMNTRAIVLTHEEYEIWGF